MTKKLAFPTGICYNNSNKIDVAEPYPRVKVVQNAQRAQKNSNYRRRKTPYTLRWNLPDSLVLQKTQVKMVFADLREIFSAFQSLSSCRNGLSHYLCINRWYPSLKQNKNSPGQRFFSTDSWLKDLSVFKQSETFSEAYRTQDNSRHQQSARFIKTKDVLSSTSPHKPLIRFRFHCLYHLWRLHRRSRSRLQPSQERGSFLPSPSLFRIPQEGILAWNFKTWGCLHISWISRIPGRMFSQGSTLCLSYQGESRCRILRSQIHRTSRREKDRLCHCSQNNQHYQEQAGRAAISQIQERLGISRVLLYSNGVEEFSSLCSDTSTITRKRFTAIYSLYAKALFLSSIRNQSFYETRECLVFLPGQSRYRNLHQRTQRKLCPGQNSNKQLSGKPNLLLFTSLRLQPCQLVQKNLFATKIPECYFADPSNRTSGFTRKVSYGTQ